MRIELAKSTRKRLLRKQYVPVTTSLMTEEGPAVGTIWFDREQPDYDPLIVKSVDDDVVLGRVNYFFDRWDRISSFINNVKEGRYVLIGVRPAPASYTVT